MSKELEIEILLKEYDTLRAEILTAMASRHSIVTFGLATVGVLWSAAATLVAAEKDHQTLAFIILALIIPFASAFIVQMWLGEYARMYRAGKFIADHSEPEINGRAGSVVLSWENNLRVGKKHMQFPYASAVLLFFSSSLISCIFGAYQMLDHSRVCFDVGVTALIAVVHLGAYWYFYGQLKNLRL